MLSHATAREWLIPYADGMLSADERQRIDGHVGGCAACGREVDTLRQLNLVLVSLPSAPPVAFAPFWLKLQANLPAPRSPRAAVGPRYRRLGFALGAAAFAVLAGASSAFAAQSALPDNPLYPIKQAEESLRLALTPPAQRLQVEIRFGSERLREAQVMAATGKPALAATSVRSFRLLIPSINRDLANTVDSKTARDDRATLDLELAAVQDANVTRGDDDAEIKQLVLTSLRQLDGDIQVTSPAVAAPPIVAPTAVTPTPVRATPRPEPRPTERPKPKPSDD